MGRADALVAVAEAYLTGQADAERRNPPVEIVVHVEQKAGADDAFAHGATLDDGTPLSVETTARLACDAALVRVVEDERGTPLDVGRRTRTIPAALKRALRLRDRGCRFPSCTNRIAEGHHILPWSESGATRLDNTVLLCRRHHGFVHERGYRIERFGASDLLFFDPRGKEVPQVSTPPALESDGLARIRSAHASAGIAIDAGTSLPRWDGKPVDYDLVLHVLCGMQGRDGEAL